MRAGATRRPGAPDRGELRAQLALAAPLAAQQAGLMLMGLVDTAVLGHFGRDALAGAGLGNALVFAITCVGMGIVMGLDALVPQALGAGRHGDTRWLLRDGLALTLWVGVPMTVLVAASPWLLQLTGAPPAAIAEAERYVWVRAGGAPLFLAQVALRSFLQAHGVTRPLLAAVLVGNLANAALDWVLVFGDRGLADLGLPAIGLPPLGTAGAALATGVVQLLTVALYAHSARVVLAGIPRTPRPPRATRRIAALGLPIGLQIGAEVGVFALTALLAGRLGELPLAGHQVAINLASMTFSLAMGIGAAAAVRVGLAVGAGDHALARRRGRTSLALGLAVMSAGALVFVVAAAPLARLFGDDEAVVAAAVPLLQVAAVFQLSDGAQAIASGCLRGCGDTRAPFVANVIGHYAVGLVVGLTCGFALGMGAVGLWWGLSAGLTVTAIGLVRRFWRVTAGPIARA